MNNSGNSRAARIVETSHRAMLTCVLGAGAALALALFAMLGLMASVLSGIGYWVDWAKLIVVAAGSGAFAGMFVWPLPALPRKQPV